LYARKSSESEERQALSIDSQIKEMYKIAEHDHLPVVEVLTEAHSAKSTGCRPVFNQMVANIKEGRFNSIITWAPDRLSRNAGDLGQLVDLMDNGLLSEIRTFGQIFKNSPNEKFLLMILCSQAKLENDHKSENVKRGLRAAAERGYRPGVAIVGYINSLRKDRPGEVLIDKQRAPIVKLMFEKGAEGWSTRKIVAWLRSINFTTRNGTYLYLSSAQKILTNTFYYGTFEYPRGSGAWHKGNHKAIITKELFDRVQVQFEVRRGNSRRERKSFGFTQLMRCGICGSGVSAEEKYKRLKDSSIVRYVYYSCNGSKGLRCKREYIREDVLIKQLINIIDQISLDELGIRKLFGEEAERTLRFHNEVMGLPYTSETQEKKDIDTKAYAKYLLIRGSIEEKRMLLCNLQSKLILRNKVVYLNEDSGLSWKDYFGHMRKCINCGSDNVNESGPYAYWKFEEKPLRDEPRVVYFNCLDCECNWKQINESNLRLLREYTVTPERDDGAWVKTSDESEIFVTPSFISPFRDPIKVEGRKIMPKNILGKIMYYEQRNIYEVTIEYDNGEERVFDIPSLRRGLDTKDGMKVISNKGLVDYKEK